MTSISETSLFWLLRLAQYTPFRGNNNSFATSGETKTNDDFQQARLEALNCPEFVGFFRERPLNLAGQDVLDLGSGYGGKTVEYGKQLGARKVVGIEPYANMVQKAVEYARSVGADNIEFRHCAHLDIPAADGEFDAILSHDVIEHVENPGSTLAEMYRVLKPNGVAYVVFTPYWGAFAHHLGYVCRAPFIHWFFGARTIVNAVNRLLSGKGGERFGTSLQPAPKRKFDGGREVLPTLNGIGGAEMLQLAQEIGFEVCYVKYPTIISRFAPNARMLDRFNVFLMKLHPFMEEAMSYNLTCILSKKPSGAATV